jgi:hypothetical protein
LENEMSMALSELSRRALSDLSGVFSALPDTAADPLIEAIASARRIALYGAGREGLALRGFAMRLFHMGRDAHVVADMTTPPIGKGDLMIVTAGQGWLPTAETFMTIAKEAGATTAIITSQPDGQAQISGWLFQPRQWRMILARRYPCCRWGLSSRLPKRSFSSWWFSNSGNVLVKQSRQCVSAIQILSDPPHPPLNCQTY